MQEFKTFCNSNYDESVAHKLYNNPLNFSGVFDYFFLTVRDDSCTKKEGLRLNPTRILYGYRYLVD